MTRRKENVTTSPAKVGKAGPAVVNESGAGWRGAEERTRYSAGSYHAPDTAAHRRPVLVDQAASDRLVEACLAPAAESDVQGRRDDKRARMRESTEAEDMAPSTRARLRWLTGGWPAAALQRHERPGSR
jgi:hypothetical protein